MTETDNLLISDLPFQKKHLYLKISLLAESVEVVRLIGASRNL
jgi:hypothetical protein